MPRLQEKEATSCVFKGAQASIKSNFSWQIFWKEWEIQNIRSNFFSDYDAIQFRIALWISSLCRKRLIFKCLLAFNHIDFLSNSYVYFLSNKKSEKYILFKIGNVLLCKGWVRALSHSYSNPHFAFCNLTEKF